MSWQIFEKITVTGFQWTKVESAATLITTSGKQQWQRLFCGNTDGAIFLYECVQDAMKGGQNCSLKLDQIVRDVSKDKKGPASCLNVFQNWKVLICIIDGMITVFNLDTLEIFQQLAGSKGCTLYSTNEDTNLLLAAGKRKIDVYVWEDAHGLSHRREITLNESPKLVSCLSSGTAAILGHKRTYEYVSLIPKSSPAAGTVKMMDVNRDHRMVTLELPAIRTRASSVLLSNGLQGVLVGLTVFDDEMSGRQAAAPRSDERLEWSSPPVRLILSRPYIISLLTDNIEIHDMVTLSSLQKIRLSSGPAQTPISNAQDMTISDLGCGRAFLYAVTLDQVNIFKMVPLAVQVESLIQAGLFHEALNIITVTGSQLLQKELADMNLYVADIYFQYATSLHQKGDFDGAVTHFMKAKAKPSEVIALFPDFVSASLYAAYSTCSQKMPLPPRNPGARLSGAVLHRAAAALITFCEYHRPRLRSYIDNLELSSTASSGSGKFLSPSDADDNDSYSSGGSGGQGSEKGIPVAEAQALAVLIDTVYLSALVNCSPARRSAVLNLLTEIPPDLPRIPGESRKSSFGAGKSTGSIGYSRLFGNQCHIESCAVLLASQGTAFTECLLWLYRSHGEHKKTLSYLTEDRCVNSSSKSGSSGWTQGQFYNWSTEYLRYLWFSEDATFTSLVMAHLKTVFEYDADLGLSVLTQRPRGLRSTGGKGISIKDVISFLESITPGATQFTLQNVADLALHSQDVDFHVPIPVQTGRSLSIAYLEWIVMSCDVPAVIQDDYAIMIIETIPMQLDVDHKANDLTLRKSDGDNLTLYKIFRKKLQNFLKRPYSDFTPEKITKALPPELMHERAFIFAKLGRHEEAFRIYCHRLCHIDAAEDYCRCVFESPYKGPDSRESKDVYIILLKALILPPSDSQLLKAIGGSTKLLEVAVDIAERNFDRIESSLFLDILPKTTPVSLVSKYLSLVIEYKNTKRKNLQVIHQLLRLREVNIRTSDVSEASHSSFFFA